MDRSGHFHPFHGPPGDTIALQLGSLEAADVVLVVPLVYSREGPPDQLHTATAAAVAVAAGNPGGIFGRHHSTDHRGWKSSGLNAQKTTTAELGGEDTGGVMTARRIIGIINSTGICCGGLCLVLVVATFRMLLRAGFSRRSTLYGRRPEKYMHRGIAVVFNVAGEEVALCRRAHGCLGFCRQMLFV